MKTAYDELLRERAQSGVNLDALLSEAQAALAVAERLIAKPGADALEAQGMKARDLGKIGRLHFLKEEYEKSLTHYTLSRDLFVELGKKRAVFLAEMRIAVLHAEHGRRDEATAEFARLQEIAEQDVDLAVYTPFLFFHAASCDLIADKGVEARRNLELARSYWTHKGAKRMLKVVDDALQHLTSDAPDLT